MDTELGAKNIESFEHASLKHGLELVDILGYGNEGIVGRMKHVVHSIQAKKAKRVTCEQEVVMKYTFRGCKEEIEVMDLVAKCKHAGRKHVVRLLNVLDDYCFTMRYEPKCDLFTCIKQQKGLADEGDLSRMCTQLSAAVQALHFIKLVHMDIKPENILVTSDATGRLIHFEIIDFGFVKKFGTVLSTKCGSTSYAAPECLLPAEIQVSAAIDIWSLGVVFLVAVLGQFAWTQAARNCKLFIRFPREGTMLLFNRLPEVVQPHLHSMLNVQPCKRKWFTPKSVAPIPSSQIPQIAECDDNKLVCV